MNINVLYWMLYLFRVQRSASATSVGAGRAGGGSKAARPSAGGVRQRLVNTILEVCGSRARSTC